MAGSMAGCGGTRCPSLRPCGADVVDEALVTDVESATALFEAGTCPCTDISRGKDALNNQKDATLPGDGATLLSNDQEIPFDEDFSEKKNPPPLPDVVNGNVSETLIP